MALSSGGLITGHGTTPRDVLRHVFGFPAFHGLQEAAIDRVMAGGDALVLMPTGGGKSLCYQVPALCRPGTAIIVSPLIALMDDRSPRCASSASLPGRCTPRWSRTPRGRSRTTSTPDASTCCMCRRSAC
jgi:hypothetical protein